MELLSSSVASPISKEGHEKWPSRFLLFLPDFPTFFRFFPSLTPLHPIFPNFWPFYCGQGVLPLAATPLLLRYIVVITMIKCNKNFYQYLPFHLKAVLKHFITTNNTLLSVQIYKSISVLQIYKENLCLKELVKPYNGWDLPFRPECCRVKWNVYQLTGSSSNLKRKGFWKSQNKISSLPSKIFTDIILLPNMRLLCAWVYSWACVGSMDLCRFW